MKEIKISAQEQNQRLDKFLMKLFNEAPKSFVYKMLRKKRIKLNGSKAEGSEILADGDVLSLYIAEETMDSLMAAKIVHPAKRHFGIIYEDDNILVVSKPAGLLTHPESASDHDTLIDQILFELYNKGQYNPSAASSFTPAVCNRLDRNTSGIIIAGKNLMSVQALNEAIKNRQVNKYYTALVVGKVDKAGEIRNYLIKNQSSNQSSTAEEGVGREAVSKYRPIISNNGYTLLEIQIITGRSHQIRAHMQAIGHPIVGDRKYGNQEVNSKFLKYALSHQFLHANRLMFSIEEGPLQYISDKELIAPLPRGLRFICREVLEMEDADLV